MILLADYPTLRNDANLVYYNKLNSVNAEVGANLSNINSVAFNPAWSGNGADGGASNSNKYLKVASAVGITGDNWTISFITKMNAAIASGQWGLVSIGQGANHNLINIYYACNGYGGAGVHEVWLRRTKNYIVSNDALKAIDLGTTNYYRITGTYDGSTLRIFVDAVQGTSASQSGNGNAGADITIFTVLSDVYESGSLASAIVQDVACFSRTLSPTEVADFANAVALTSNASFLLRMI